MDGGWEPRFYRPHARTSRGSAVDDGSKGDSFGPGGSEFRRGRTYGFLSAVFLHVRRYTSRGGGRDETLHRVFFKDRREMHEPASGSLCPLSPAALRHRAESQEHS